MPLTAEGFQRKLYDDFIEEMEQRAVELFGESINLSENGPMGKWIRMVAYAAAEAEELAEQVYLSSFVDHAEGINLDSSIKSIGMTRLQGEKATVTANITVDAGATIPSGTILSTIDGIEFQTTADITDSNNDGLITVSVEAVEAGISGNIAANTLTVAITPVAGLLSVTNPTVGTGGQDPETDKELRDRHADIGANSLSSTINGIRATILNDVPTAISCMVLENYTNATDSNGLPPNSIHAIVYGGDSADIAAAIFKAKAGGIQPYGATTVIVKDDSGNDQTVKFSYATQVNIYVKADITANTSFPANGNDLVITEIIKYIGGTDADNTVYPGLGMGQSVINAKLTSAIIANVEGVDDVVITFSTDGTTYTGGNKTITITQVAQTAVDKVAVI
jgi:uncharacterized phage protein gp47/JayE